ncbi:MAG: hypothetical protein ABI167_07725 [Nitrosospira sp.]
MMSNVYKFPEGNHEKCPKDETLWNSILGNFLFALLAFVASLVCMVMLWLRFPLVLVCNFVFGLGLFGALIGWMISKPEMAWTCIAMSIAAFAIRWAYDLLMVAIVSPFAHPK